MYVLWSQNLLHCLFSFSQVQSIKQNSSSLKQSLNEGIDVFRPAEVSVLVQLSPFTSFSTFSLLHIPLGFWFLFTCLWSLFSLSLISFIYSLCPSPTPSRYYFTPCGTEISLNLLFALMLSFSPLSPFLSYHPSSLPSLSLPLRWTLVGPQRSSSWLCRVSEDYTSIFLPFLQSPHFAGFIHTPHSPQNCISDTPVVFNLIILSNLFSSSEVAERRTVITYLLVCCRQANRSDEEKINWIIVLYSNYNLDCKFSTYSDKVWMTDVALETLEATGEENKHALMIDVVTITRQIALMLARPTEG